MKKKGNKTKSGGAKPSETGPPTPGKKLSPQKKNELNGLIEKLLKVTSSTALGKNAVKYWEMHLEIDKILTKVITLEKDISIPLPERDVICAQKLAQWMEENNSTLNGIEISDFGEFGYGLRATKKLSKNELIISIPRKVMLTSEDLCCEMCDLLRSDPLLQNMPNITLAMLLLIERFKKDSFWSPYINMLPTSYNTVMYFNLEELKELKGSPTFEAALKQCKNIARQYAYFYTLFQRRTDAGAAKLRDVFTYEHYRWAVSTVMTRQNFVPSLQKNGGKVHAFIPFWDMANHTNGKLTTDYKKEEEECACYAAKGFEKGDQVVICYGVRPNYDLLIHNGFVYPDNIHDALEFPLGVSQSDPLYAKRTQLLDSLGIPSSGHHTIHAGPKPVREPLLAFLRVFCMTEEYLDKWLSSNEVQTLGSEECTIEPCVSNKVWEFLLMRIKLLLAAYPSKLEEDENLLSSKPDITPCHKLTILQRIGERKLLLNALDVVNEFLKPGLE